MIALPTLQVGHAKLALALFQPINKDEDSSPKSMQDAVVAVGKVAHS
jgi:hypothetical protein